MSAAILNLVQLYLQAEAHVTASKAETDRKSANEAKAASDKASAAADALAASLKERLSDTEKVGQPASCNLMCTC
jgi:hypothetical protein